MTQIERLMYVRVTSCVEGVHFTLQTDRTNFVFPSSRIILHTKDLNWKKCHCLMSLMSLTGFRTSWEPPPYKGVGEHFKFPQIVGGGGG